MGLGSPGRGAPGIPSLVFLERLNGKRLADGRSPTQPQGSQRCWNPPPTRTLDLVIRDLEDSTPSGGPAVMHHPGCAPLGGEIKVQTMVPLWAERHQGGGVAPGCKALAEEAWGAHRLPQTVPLCPSTAGCLGDTQLCPLGPWGIPSL